MQTGIVMAEGELERGLREAIMMGKMAKALIFAI